MNPNGQSSSQRTSSIEQKFFSFVETRVSLKIEHPFRGMFNEILFQTDDMYKFWYSIEIQCFRMHLFIQSMASFIYVLNNIFLEDEIRLVEMSVL